MLWLQSCESEWVEAEFFHTNQGGLGFKWHPQQGLESFPGIIHGGIGATLLDEIGGVLIQAELDRFALTISNRINYHYPVYSDRPVLGHACIIAKYKKYVLVEGKLFDERSRILSTMQGLYFIPHESMFQHVTKIKDMSKEIASYVEQT